MVNKLSRGAKNYIDSLVKQTKIFTTNTVKRWFPVESDVAVEEYAKEVTKGKGYVAVSDFSCIPSKFFAENGTKKTEPVKIMSNKSMTSGKNIIHVSLNKSVIEKFKLSARTYKYSIKGDNIIIHRDSTNKALKSFNVWKTQRASIPVDSVKEYSVEVR